MSGVLIAMSPRARSIRRLTAISAFEYMRICSKAESSRCSKSVQGMLTRTPPGGSYKSCDGGSLDAKRIRILLKWSTQLMAVLVNINWSTVSGATQYQVYFGSSSASLSLYATVSAPATSTALYNLNAGTTYYWKMVALAGSSSASSGVWSFKTPGGSTLSPPTVVWPQNGATGTPTTLTVQWSPVAGATQYQVYFGGTSSSLALYATVNAPSVNAAFYNLSAASTYYWKVVALAGGSSASSAVWSFRTN